MAYVPPHKRLSKKDDGEGSSQSPLPKPELPPFLIKYRNPKHKSSSSTTAHYQDTGYEYEDIFRWFAVGLDDHNLLPPSVHLHNISVESLDGKFVKRRALYHDRDLTEESSSTVVTERPWEYIADTVLPDLVSSFEDLRREIESQKLVGIKPSIITRFGKVLFSRGPSLLSEDELRPLRRSLNTNIPDSFVNYITKEGVSKNGLEFAKDKEAYHVFLSDFNQSEEDIFCDCRVLKEDGKLQIYEIKRAYVRHMLRDISCLEKDLDMRLDLCTRRPVTTLTDDELQGIKELVDSAILDREVKGGLRWPLGNAVSGDKIRVTAVWHVISKKYKKPSLKLKIKNVDRYKFLSSTEEPTREVVIMLKGVASELMKQRADMNLISEMLKDDLKAIWNNFLCCERFP